MLEMLQYPFMQRAVIAGIILAGILAILGVFVLIRRMAFFSDGIAHASLAGIAVGIILSWYPLATALALSAVFALIIYFLEKKFELASDMAIGILFTSGMALGVLLISLQPGYQPELLSFLFGNILAISTAEVWIIAVLSALILIFTLRYLRQLTLLSLDESLAYVSGIKTSILQPLFYVFLALTVVLGIKILGVILVSALLIIPAATSRILASSFKHFLILSVCFAEIVVLGGIFLSFLFDLPTGPVIVLTGTAIFIFSLGWKALSSK